MQVVLQPGLAIAATHLHPYQAELAKALLESHGAPAWVLDEQQIRMRLHLSDTLGGVEIAVAQEDLARASRIITEDKSADLADIPEDQLPPHADEICPAWGNASGLRNESGARSATRTLLEMLGSKEPDESKATTVSGSGALDPPRFALLKRRLVRLRAGRRILAEILQRRLAADP